MLLATGHSLAVDGAGRTHRPAVQAGRLTGADLPSFASRLDMARHGRSSWHTDLLDFLGAQAARGLDAAAFPAQSGNAGRPGTMLPARQGTAALVDDYAADLDLNDKLRCVGPGNLGRHRKCHELVEDWIRETHGATPRPAATVASAFFSA